MIMNGGVVHICIQSTIITYKKRTLRKKNNLQEMLQDLLATYDVCRGHIVKARGKGTLPIYILGKLSGGGSF